MKKLLLAVFATLCAVFALALAGLGIDVFNVKSAVVQNNLIGGARKKIGNVVFSQIFGRHTLRNKPAHVHNPRTRKQTAQRDSFKVVVALARYTLDAVRAGYKTLAKHKSAFNAWESYNIKNAVYAPADIKEINFPLLRMADGTLEGVIGATATAASGHKVNIAWSDNSTVGDAAATDGAVVVIINDTKKSDKFDQASKTRMDVAVTETVDTSWVGDLVHVYLWFQDQKVRKNSQSVYVGDVTIVA